MPRRRTTGFTLIELLTVMVIAAILIGLTVPVVTSLMSSGGVGAASREVANELGLARQYAITQRTYARVVFPYSQTRSRPDLWYRTYAIMTNRDNSASATTPWVYATKWEYLPVGAVFLQTVPGGGTGRGALDDQKSLNIGAVGTAQGTMPFPSPGVGSGGQLAYIEFGPTGAGTALGFPPSSANPSILAITEGFTNPNTGTLTLAAPKTSTNTLANLTTITVDSLVGRIQVAR
jgi:prepilin-type N-terminal cleavage/methylation domain-containing protein